MPPASGLAGAVMAPCYLQMTVIMEPGCSWAKTDAQSSELRAPAEGWFPWQLHQHLNDFLSLQVCDLMSSLLNFKGKPESG